MRKKNVGKKYKDYQLEYEELGQESKRAKRMGAGKSRPKLWRIHLRRPRYIRQLLDKSTVPKGK